MFTGQLHPYQVDGVAKMVDKSRLLVAYDLGTGKTILAIAAIEALRDSARIRRSILVVCLQTLKYQWQESVYKFTDVDAIVIDGPPKARQKQYASADTFEYVIVNYEQVVNDWAQLSSIGFDAIILDEATAIKSFRSKRSKKVKELGKRVDIRFALTGTPIENGKPEELYSIMQFVEPSLLGRFDIFDAAFIVRNQFGGVQRYRNLPILHEKLKEWSVRKRQTDPDVAPYLPDAIHRPPVFVQLDRASKALYTHISNDLISLLTEAQQLFGAAFDVAAHYGQRSAPGDPAGEMRGKIMSVLGALRMLCSGPRALMSSYQKFDAHEGGSAYVHSLGELLSGLTKTPKVDALVSLLSDHLTIDFSYKAVVFASYLDSVDDIVCRLNAAGFKAVAHTGQMSAVQKNEAKVQFQTDPDTRVFVSSDAGGYGVDLPQANLLINFDQPWSSGLMTQRNGRIKRASSTWPTIAIQDLIVRDSIDQRQWDMLRQKQDIAEAILDGKNINEQGGVDLTIGSLLEFLKGTLTKEG